MSSKNVRFEKKISHGTEIHIKHFHYMRFLNGFRTEN